MSVIRTEFDSQSASASPLLTSAARLVLQYARLLAASDGAVIPDDYSSELVTLFAEEMHTHAKLATVAVSEPVPAHARIADVPVLRLN